MNSVPRSQSSASTTEGATAMDAERLFRAHAPYVARILSRLGVAGSELDDAVQEVFLVVHRKGGYTPGPASPTGYLASIALRAAAAHRRRARKSRDRKAEVAPDDVRSPGQDPARSLEVQQSLEQLQGALERLEPSLRTTLVLAEIEGQSCKAIAESMRIPVGTVYWRLHRARKDFRVAVAAEAGRTDERAPRELQPALAAGAFLFGAAERHPLLELARKQPPPRFDIAAALERLRALLKSGASIPPWAAGVPVAKIAAGLAAAVAVPAIAAGIAMVSLGGAALHEPPAAHVALAGTAAPARFDAPGPAAIPVATDDPAPPAVGPVSGAERTVTPLAPLAVRAPLNPSAAGHAARVASATQAIAAPAPVTVAVAPIGAASATAPSPDDMEEIEQTANASRWLALDPERALSMVDSGEARYQAGYMREERRYIGVMALAKLGRGNEARARADQFLRDYPDGPYSAKVRAAVPER